MITPIHNSEFLNSLPTEKHLAEIIPLFPPRFTELEIVMNHFERISRPPLIYTKSEEVEELLNKKLPEIGVDSDSVWVGGQRVSVTSFKLKPHQLNRYPKTGPQI